MVFLIKWLFNRSHLWLLNISNVWLISYPSSLSCLRVIILPAIFFFVNYEYCLQDIKEEMTRKRGHGISDGKVCVISKSVVCLTLMRKSWLTVACLTGTCSICTTNQTWNIYWLLLPSVRLVMVRIKNAFSVIRREIIMKLLLAMMRFRARKDISSPRLELWISSITSNRSFLV